MIGCPTQPSKVQAVSLSSLWRVCQSPAIVAVQDHVLEIEIAIKVFRIPWFRVNELF